MSCRPRRQQAVVLAAKDDYEGGYLTRLRDLLQAEVFASELKQADELFDKNYILAAAVIAGTVLETTLRQLCKDHQLQLGSLDRMNADLAKAGVDSSLMQKRITAPRPMKMGNTRSPWHYDVVARCALQSKNLRRPAILCYAL